MTLSEENDDDENEKDLIDGDPKIKATQQRRLKEKQDKKKEEEKEAMLRKRATFSLLTDNYV